MNKKILGLSIVEALVATVIVGIGFVAVLQMTSFAVTSIDTSGERTKANYLVAMIAEDIIGHKDSVYGVNPEEEKIVRDASGNILKADGSDADESLELFSTHLKDDNFKEIVKYSDAIGDYYQELWPDVVSTSKTAYREVIQRGGLYGFNNGKRCIELPQPKAYTASRFFDIPCTYKGISEPLDPDVEPEPTAFGWMIHKYCASKEDNASFNVSMTLEGHTTGSQGQDFMDFLRNNMPAAKLTPTRTVPTGEKTWHCHRGPIDGRCYRDPNSSGMVFVPVGLDENTFDYNRSGYTELEQLQHWAGQNITTSSGQATWTAHADPEVPGSGTEHTFDYTQINVAAFVSGAPPNLCWDSFVRDVNAADGPVSYTHLTLPTKA
mgnify:CR=1 FL=1